MMAEGPCFCSAVGEGFPTALSELRSQSRGISRDGAGGAFRPKGQHVQRPWGRHARA